MAQIVISIEKKADETLEIGIESDGLDFDELVGAGGALIEQVNENAPGLKYKHAAQVALAQVLFAKTE